MCVSDNYIQKHIQNSLLAISSVLKVLLSVPPPGQSLPQLDYFSLTHLLGSLSFMGGEAEGVRPGGRVQVCVSVVCVRVRVRVSVSACVCVVRVLGDVCSVCLC